MDDEVDMIQRETASVTFRHTVNVLSDRFNIPAAEDAMPEADDFDEMYTVPREERGVLDIRMGDDQIPRFSCACHKLNIAIRWAIEKQRTVSRALARLNSANVDIRRPGQLGEPFRIAKCRLRLENDTRWSSAYLMLESVKRAYDKGLFDAGSVECPVPLETVEAYIQILKPAYLLSVSFQKRNSSIGDVIPGRLIRSCLLKSLKNDF